MPRKSAKKITKKVIRKLQALKGDNILSGDDSGLKNAWDEICVQVQLEDSIFGGLYEGLTYEIISDFVSELDVEYKKAIWLQTSSGYDWHYEADNPDVSDEIPSGHRSKTFDEIDIPYDEDEITEYIYDEYIYSAAEDYTNVRIDHFLWS